MRETFIFYSREHQADVVSFIYRGKTCAQGDDPSVVLAISAMDLDGNEILCPLVLEALTFEALEAI